MRGVAAAEADTDDEAEWARIADLDDAGVLEAATREWQAAATAADAAWDEVVATARSAMGRGMSAYRAAKIVGVSERHMGRLRRPAAGAPPK